MVYLALMLMLTPVAAYWLATILAARGLQRERRRLGHTGELPELFDPTSSHRWFGIVLTQKTAELSPSTRRAFLVARMSLALVPIGIVAALTVASSANLPDRGPPAGTPPPVTLHLPQPG